VSSFLVYSMVAIRTICIYRGQAPFGHRNKQAQRKPLRAPTGVRHGIE
jgi:hypothetical protein